MNWRELLRSGWQNLPQTVRRLILGGSIAAVFLIILTFVGSRDVQIFAVIGLFLLFLLVQSLILYVMWRQHPEVRQARQAFVAGNFDETIRILEDASQSEGGLEVTGLTLLGNAYRQVVRLEDSERVLREAHAADPKAPFAAYGLGRTLLVSAQYDEAVTLLKLAVSRRGPAVILADLGHAQYRAGLLEEAKRSLSRADGIQLEPHRALLTRYLLGRLDETPLDDEHLRSRVQRYDFGLDFWRSEAERFEMTPYGAALAEDIVRIESMLEEESDERTESETT